MSPSIARRDIQGSLRTTILLAVAATGVGCVHPSTSDVSHSTEDRVLASTAILREDDMAGAWDRWRSNHPDATLADLDAHVGRTLRTEPFEDRFFATAYASPIHEARRRPDERFRHPIFATPVDAIATSDLPVRRGLADCDLDRIAWLENGLDAYLIEINGAARLDLPDGERLHLGWGRTNEHPYTSLGRLLIDRGFAAERDMDLAKIRSLHRSSPATVETLMLENDRVVFFDVIRPERWPRASTGERLVADGSVAVDPTVVPLGSIIRVRGPSIGTRYAIAVDTGGAIKGRRLDLYLGAGPEAMAKAGGLREWVEVDLVRPHDVP